MNHRWVLGPGCGPWLSSEYERVSSLYTIRFHAAHYARAGRPGVDHNVGHTGETVPTPRTRPGLWLLAWWVVGVQGWVTSSVTF